MGTFSQKATLPGPTIHTHSTNNIDTRTVSQIVIGSVGLFVVRGGAATENFLPWSGLELEPETSHNHGS